MSTKPQDYWKKKQQLFFSNLQQQWNVVFCLFWNVFLWSEHWVNRTHQWEQTWNLYLSVWVLVLLLTDTTYSHLKFSQKEFYLYCTYRMKYRSKADRQIHMELLSSCLTSACCPQRIWSFVILSLQRMAIKLSSPPGMGKGWRKRKQKENRQLMTGDKCAMDMGWPFVSSVTMPVQWEYLNTSSVNGKWLALVLRLMCSE